MIDLLFLALFAIVLLAIAISVGIIAIPASITALSVMPIVVAMALFVAFFLWLFEVNAILAVVLWLCCLVASIVWYKKRKLNSSTAQ